jgi:hypothetical protein
MAYVPKAPAAPLDKYVREYVNETGIVSTWYYDKSISTAGPYRVDHKYSKEYLDSLKEKKKKVKHVK